MSKNGTPNDPEIPEALQGAIRRCMQVHADAQARLGFWLISLSSYYAHPTPTALAALGTAIADLDEVAALIAASSKELVTETEKMMRAEGKDA